MMEESTRNFKEMVVSLGWHHHLCLSSYWELGPFPPSGTLGLLLACKIRYKYSKNLPAIYQVESLAARETGTCRKCLERSWTLLFPLATAIDQTGAGLFLSQLLIHRIMELCHSLVWTIKFGDGVLWWNRDIRVKKGRLNGIFVCLLDHTEQCSVAVPGSELRNHLWWEMRGTIWDTGDRTWASHMQLGKHVTPAQ